MLKNYFKIAFRNLARGKSSSFINISGLSIGMAVAMIIGLWIYDEVGFDKNFDNHNQIARVIQNVTNNGETQTWWSVPYPLAEELRKNYGSDFKHVIMVGGWGDHIVTIGEKKLKTTGAYAEHGLTAMLTLPMIRGSRASLNDPASVILSASTAKAWFGNDDPVNKIIKADDQPVLKVTGVYADFPRNSTFNGLGFISTWDFYYSNSDGLKNMTDPWRPNAFSLFVQLNDQVDINKASAKIRDAKLKRVNALLAKKKPELFLYPMNSWHLYAEFKNGKNTGGAIQYVWLFGIIAVFVLLLACINFMNLSTARSEKRAKEVGIRKTVGSLASQLVMQFFGESLVTVFLSFILAVLLVQLSLPFFNEVADKQMHIQWSNPLFWLIALGVTLITALIAGCYPAFYLSSFKPIKVLKGTFKAGKFAAVPRKVLVVLQFTISVTFIIGTAIVYRQIQYAKNRPVGYTRNGLVNVPEMNDNIHKHFDAIRNELMQAHAITSMAESGSPTTGIYSSTSGLNWQGKDPNLSIDFGNIDASWDYGKTIGWEFAAGRDFSRDFLTDSSALILNEAAAKFMGFKNPLGQVIVWWGKPYTVIGVVKDMVMNSPYDEPKPTVFALATESENMAILKLNPSTGTKDALAAIESVIKKYNPDSPFEYQFVDQEYAKKFGDEERIGKLSGFFALLAIFISCLGLFGLASFVAEQRTREIGIRKVLGASVFGVWNLLSRDFILLILISLLIAGPVAYYFMYKWLLNYHYRTGISFWVFLAAGAGAMLITLVTVSFQAIKAALANPVKSLRTE